MLLVRFWRHFKRLAPTIWAVGLILSPVFVHAETGLSKCQAGLEYPLLNMSPNSQDWANAEVVPKSGLPVFENLIKFSHHPLSSLLELSAASVRGIHALGYDPVGRQRLILLDDPDVIPLIFKAHLQNKDLISGIGKGAHYDVKHALGKSLPFATGMVWEQMRKIIQPQFKGKLVADFAKSTAAITDRVLSTFANRSEGLFEFTDRLTFEVFMNSVLGFPTSADMWELLNQWNVLSEEFTKRTYFPFYFPMQWQPSFMKNKISVANEKINAILSKRIAAAKQELETRENKDPNDLTEALILTTDDSGQPIPEDQIISEIKAQLIAGHETTSALLGWSLFLLSTHPDQLKLLREEVQSLNLGDNEFEFKNLSRLTLLHAVINESMRLFPPFWFIPKITNQDLIIRNYRIPKGTSLIISPWAVHRDQRTWADADQFRPQRWLDKENTDELKSACYIPFGGGPRYCVGAAFAKAEIATFLVKILSEYSVVVSGDTDFNLDEVKPGLALKFDNLDLNIEFKPLPGGQ